MSSDIRLSAQAVRWMNREIAHTGQRVCVECQGHAQPLDEQHFRLHKGYYEHTCVVCVRKREAARARERYLNGDEAFHAHYRAVKQAYRRTHLERHKAQCRASHHRKKVARLARVLQGVKP